MEKSTEIKNLAIALCKFQGAVEKIKKGENNPFFKSKYASLADILDVIRLPLYENGLSFVQLPCGSNGLTTMLMHESGEYIMETYEMTPIKNDPQSQGSAITYQRRYSLSSILGLNIDNDDDGNAASTPAELIEALNELSKCETKEDIEKKKKKHLKLQKNQRFYDAVKDKGREIK